MTASDVKSCAQNGETWGKRIHEFRRGRGQQRSIRRVCWRNDGARLFQGGQRAATRAATRASTRTCMASASAFTEVAQRWAERGLQHEAHPHKGHMKESGPGGSFKLGPQPHPRRTFARSSSFTIHNALDTEPLASKCPPLCCSPPPPPCLLSAPPCYARKPCPHILHRHEHSPRRLRALYLPSSSPKVRQSVAAILFGWNFIDDADEIPPLSLCAN